jgi:glycosyltransferase involved in cell wall biosynthesis
LVGASGFRRHADLPVRNACNENGLVLVYAGFPGRKELFPEIIAGVQAARRDGIDVVLQLVGINYADLCRILRRDRGLLPEAGVVVCHGKVKREAALEFVQASDFTILLRPQKRYANAGFPSKVVESLSLGVPVMTNVTSDLGEYLRDGRDGFLLRGPTAEAVNEAIHRAARMTPDQGSAMRDDARLRAQQCFSFRNFAGVLADFIASARLC